MRVNNCLTFKRSKLEEIQNSQGNPKNDENESKNGISCPTSKRRKNLTKRDKDILFFPVKAEVPYFLILRRY